MYLFFCISIFLKSEKNHYILIKIEKKIYEESVWESSLLEKICHPFISRIIVFAVNYTNIIVKYMGIYPYVICMKLMQLLFI